MMLHLLLWAQWKLKKRKGRHHLTGVRLREVAARVVVDSPIGGLLGVLLDVVDQQRLREVAAVQAIGSAQPQDFRGKNQFPATKTA